MTLWPSFPTLESITIILVINLLKTTLNLIPTLRSDNTFVIIKLTGHTMDQCYKIHGYPPTHKYHSSKKTVAVAQRADNEDPTEIESTGLTHNQFHHLLQLLGKKEPTGPISDFSQPHDSANLAGTFCFLSSSIYSGWIIDSGATDHKCNNSVYSPTSKLLILLNLHL